MKGHLTMSAKERKRKSLFDMVEGGIYTLRDVSEKLNLSYRQCRRSYKRYREEGDKGLVHRSRGRPSNRAVPGEFRRMVIERYKECYTGFGPTLAGEYLEKDGYKVDHETLRLWLLAAGEWKRARKKRRHRCRRDRRKHFGELLQMDGSHHHWFGPEEPECCLMNIVDDATGITCSRMASGETTEIAMRTLWDWIEEHGVPRALYTDRKSVFVTDREPTIEEQLAGEEPLTAFGAACRKLDIEIIPAGSPQAKGRVERNHGVYQDRLVKELKLKGIKTIEEANKLLRDSFCEHLNSKFARSPKSPQDSHWSLPKRINLEDIFCFEDIRTLSNDWTIRHKNAVYQIHKENKILPRPKEKLIVRTLLDGTVKIIYRKKPLLFSRIQIPKTATEGVLKTRVSPEQNPGRSGKDHRTQNHWNYI